MKKRRNFKQEEERRHPDAPGGLEVVASSNRAFAERITGIIRLRLAEVKNGKR
ncbi:hypothetical protein [Serratia fonticola]